MPKTLSLLEDSWLAYRKMTMHPDAPDFQIAALLQAFYAGATVVCDTMIELGKPHISEEVGVAFVESFKREIDIFFSRVPGIGDRERDSPLPEPVAVEVDFADQP